VGQVPSLILEYVRHVHSLMALGLTNGSGGLNSHLVNPRYTEVAAATQRSDLVEFVDNLMRCYSLT
jgi:hypothetical protein